MKVNRRELFKQVHSTIQAVLRQHESTIEGQSSGMHSRLPRVCFMHETRFVSQSQAVESGNGRITAEERSDSGML